MGNSPQRLKPASSAATLPIDEQFWWLPDVAAGVATFKSNDQSSSITASPFKQPMATATSSRIPKFVDSSGATATAEQPAKGDFAAAELQQSRLNHAPTC